MLVATLFCMAFTCLLTDPFTAFVAYLAIVVHRFSGSSRSVTIEHLFLRSFLHAYCVTFVLIFSFKASAHVSIFTAHSAYSMNVFTFSHAVQLFKIFLANSMTSNNFEFKFKYLGFSRSLLLFCWLVILIKRQSLLHHDVTFPKASLEFHTAGVYFLLTSSLPYPGQMHPFICYAKLQL